ncbi:MAG: methyltransferase domain-containing protein [Pseudomonadota bacterium]|nr:methyltransferase domain-containing protein [Pseudomonadota bacterium]
MDLKELELAGGDAASHWYYRAKSEMMLSHLHGLKLDSVMDIGSGSGFFARQILQNTSSRDVICVDPGYDADLAEEVGTKTLRFVRSVETADCDLMVMMDVLEHIEDDVGFLGDYAGMAQPGTHLFVTVPAFQFLWSGHDVFLEHFRRYTLGSLTRLVRGAGFDIVRSHYFFGAAFPLAATLRLKDRLLPGGAPRSSMRSHSQLVNNMAYRVCRAEMALMTLNRFAGLSAVMLARKHGT